MSRALVVVAFIFAVVVGFANDARAQLFAPGPLSKAHASLEGVGNCVKCHGEGSQHDNNHCLDCHSEIAKRKGQGAGYHGRLGAQLCAECHREHRGVSASIIDWPSGQRAFNHSLTTWPLVGQHKKADCKKCHEVRRIVDEDARKLQAKGRDTFLGMPEKCSSCHFDEHRSEFGAGPGENCAKCHTPDGFKPPKLFDHNNKSMTKYPLTGLHKKVVCTGCHQNLVDDRTAAGAFPSPKSKTYLQMGNVDHATCVDCHEDAHRGAFGRNCTQCHTTAGWSVILQTADDFGFHDKTKFPLRGEHTSVACKTCHGPFPGQKAVFKGLPHEHCADCHADAHVGQLAKDDSGGVPCEKCHTVAGFLPVLFDTAMHEKTRFALASAHQAIACTACHTADDKLARKSPAVIKAKLERQRRKLVLSDTRLDLPVKALGEGAEAPVRCESCHDDVHAGQFDARIKEKGCNGCHEATSFRKSLFNHDDSRFALTGKHKDVACSKCHVEEAPKKKKGDPVVRYRPLNVTCAGCHSDEHVGQLAKDGVTDCKRCHDTGGFKPATFKHDDPAQTRFVLEGKHKDVACIKCHAAVAVPGVDGEGKTTSRYKPVPMDCASCHDDEHNGSFDRFAP